MRLERGAGVRIMLYSKGSGEPLVSSGDVLSKSGPGQKRSGVNPVSGTLRIVPGPRR